MRFVMLAMLALAVWMLVPGSASALVDPPLPEPWPHLPPVAEPPFGALPAPPGATWLPSYAEDVWYYADRSAHEGPFGWCDPVCVPPLPPRP